MQPGTLRKNRYDSNLDEDSDDPEIANENPIKLDNSRNLTENDAKETIIISNYTSNPSRFNMMKSNEKSIDSLTDHTMENWTNQLFTPTSNKNGGFDEITK